MEPHQEQRQPNGSSHGPGVCGLGRICDAELFQQIRHTALKRALLSTTAFNPAKVCTGADQGTSAFNTANGLLTCKTVPSGTPFLDTLNYSVPADAGAGDPENQSLVVGRVDWNISDKTQLYGRYAFNKQNLFAGTVSNSAYVGYDTTENITENNFVLSVTHTFSPVWTFQNKVLWNRLNDFQPLGTAPISP